MQQRAWLLHLFLLRILTFAVLNGAVWTKEWQPGEVKHPFLYAVAQN
jgi:hypothetical protein